MVKLPSYHILWDRKSLDHIKEILSYLENQNRQAPKIVKAALTTILELIKTNPFINEFDNLSSIIKKRTTGLF